MAKEIGNHNDLSDAEFERQFRDCELDHALFNHEAHLRLAWIHIDNYGLEVANFNIQKQIQDFVVHVGANDKYHKTLTIAAIHVVKHFMEKSKADKFKEFIKEFPQLKNGFKTLIERHYSFDIFNSAKAKATFLAPDLIPFN